MIHTLRWPHLAAALCAAALATLSACGPGVGGRSGVAPLRRGLGRRTGTACRAQPSHGPGADLRRLAICRGTNLASPGRL